MALFKGKGGNPPNMIKTKDFTMLRFVVLSSCAIFACGFLLKYRSSTSHCYLRRRSLSGRTPISKGELFRTQSKDILRNILLTSSILASLLPIKQAKAMGTLFQYKNQPVIFQDVSFNVIDTQKAADFYLATFPNLCRILRTTRSNNNVNTTVLAFGPDAYASPKNFLPGISSFYADGGHATLTLRSEQFNDDTVAIYESGDAIQSIKIGVDNFRVSKAIEKGANIKYSYGWIDLDDPNKIPLQLVVGVARDPIMLVALKVSNMKDSIDFFTTQMGMSVQPFPLARKAGSNFEEQQVKDSVYLSYTPDSLGILLLPPAKKALSPPSAGSQLNAFTFIVDDSSSRSEESVLPPLARAFLENEGPSQVYSPDGIPIRFRKYSGFEKEATKSIEF